MRRFVVNLGIGIGFGLLLLGILIPVSAQPRGQGEYPAYSFSYITTNATTAVLSGAGVLHTICINDAGATGNTATVYNADNAAANAFALIDTVELNGRCLLYDVAVTNGITVVTATGTAANLTVSYRALR